MSDSTVNNDVHSSSSKNYQWLIQITNADAEETTHDDNQRKGPAFPTVPSTFRDIQQNSDCYDPSVVSIGPYHHGNTKLKEMEKLKETYAREFVEDTEKPIDDIYREMEAVLRIAKNSNPEDARRDFNDEQFSVMMFIDGCFIVQFLFCLYMKPGNLKMSSHDAALVTKDLFLLENQLPFKVLTAFCDQVRAFPAGTELKEKITKIFCELPRSIINDRKFPRSRT